LRNSGKRRARPPVSKPWLERLFPKITSGTPVNLKVAIG
jgi:hypothetical protein